MSGPDLIDERFDDLVRELRSGEATASPELRERVRAIAQREPTSPRRRPPASGGSGGAGSRSCSSRSRRRSPRRSASASSRSGTDVEAQANVSAPSPRACSTGRGQHRLPIAPSPAATGRAGQACRLRAVAAASPLAAERLARPALRRRRSSSASTASRRRRSRRSSSRAAGAATSSRSTTARARSPAPPISSCASRSSKVQTAVAKLSALGTIVGRARLDPGRPGPAQQALQPDAGPEGDDRRAPRQAHRHEPDRRAQRAFFEATLARRVAQLAELQDRQTAQKARASFATLSLDLETKKAAAVVPSKPGQIGQALHNIGRVLVTEAEILLYVLLIGAPFIVLAALLIGVPPHAPAPLGGPAARPLREDRPRGRATIRRGLARAPTWGTSQGSPV